MTHLYEKHFTFFEEAKKAFKNNERFETYQDMGMMALRTGQHRDCMVVYEIDKEVAVLHHCLEPAERLVRASKNNEMKEEYDRLLDERNDTIIEQQTAIQNQRAALENIEYELSKLNKLFDNYSYDVRYNRTMKLNIENSIDYMRDKLIKDVLESVTHVK